MALEWIPLEQLQPHPENSNRMPPRLLEKLKRHIQRTGLYEPLVVRPIHCELRIADCGLNNGECGVRNAECGVTTTASCGADAVPSTPHSTLRTPHSSGNPQFQILNGHHRAEVLRQLGHTHARCDVWLVGDDDARLLLATLNRLEGRDDPAARARLVAHLAEGRPAEDLARLLPEPPDAIERLMKLSAPPPSPLAPEAAAPVLRPMTFFLTEAQHALAAEALREIARAGRSAAVAHLAPRTGGGAAADAPSREGPPCIHGGLNKTAAARASTLEPRPPTLPRGECLERLALWYLEARNLR